MNENEPPQSQDNDLTEVYDQWYSSGQAHWEDAPGKQVLVNALKVCCSLSEPLRLLDIACGTGSFLARINEEVSAQWYLHGTDFSSVAVDEAQARFPDFHFTCDDATELDSQDGSFDIVTSYGSWEHFKNPAKAISTAGRILRPGGWVFAMIPTLGVHRTDRLDEGWYEDVEVNGVAERQSQWNFTRPTWGRMFEAAGIQLVDSSLARRSGAVKPGVFYFGVKMAQGFTEEADSTGVALADSSRGLLELGQLAGQVAYQVVSDVERGGQLVFESLERGGKVLVAGNGGSAADAQHFVAELVGRLNRERQSLPALALTTNSSVVTAVSNDYGYENVFARQVEGLGQPGDVLIVISASGRSKNILRAVEAARRRELRTVALLGRGGDPMLEDCDVCVHIPSGNTQRVQELHIAILHAVGEQVDENITARTAED